MMQNLMISLFMLYSRTLVQIRVKSRIWKNEYVAFGLFCDFIEKISSILTAAFVYVTSTRIELKDAAWISVCEYFPEGNIVYAVGAYNPVIVPETKETYSKVHERHLREWPTEPSSVLDSGYRDVFYLKYANVKEMINAWDEDEQKDTIVIAKLCPNAIIIKNAENMEPEKDLVFSRVNFRFMEVEYKCGDMLGFSIDIPESHYITGNEILSKTYILRHLEHLPIYIRWFHDEDYVLKIVDEDMNVITLNCNQYIRLNEDSYEVVDTTLHPSIETEEVEVEVKEVEVEVEVEVKEVEVEVEETKQNNSDTDSEEYQMVQN